MLEFLVCLMKACSCNCKNICRFLQFLVETKLKMEPADKDMIVMLHEFEYELEW